MGTMNVRLPDGIEQRWREQCAAAGIAPSTALRQVVVEQLAISPDDEPVVKVPKSGKRTVKQYTLLTEAEREGVRLRARLHGLRRSAWVSKIIRAELSRAPVLDAEQTAAVKDSNYQLLAIGKNVNQIARRLNEHQDAQAKALELAELQTIRDEIQAHVSKVNALIDAATGRR